MQRLSNVSTFNPVTGSNWVLLFKLDKDGTFADVVIVRGGDHGDAIAKARVAATNRIMSLGRRHRKEMIWEENRCQYYLQQRMVSRK